MVRLSPSQQDRVSAYLDELYRWNARINLTSVPRAAAWERHVEQSLDLLAAAAPASEAVVVDIGSGAGLPGIVMALMRPDLSVALVEADVRKAAFLDHVAGLLGLSHVRVHNRRAEALASDPAHAGTYDILVSRAAMSAVSACRIAEALLRPGGMACLLVADADRTARELAGRLAGMSVAASAPQVLTAVLLPQPRPA